MPKKELIVIVAEGCPGCEELVNTLKAQKTKFKVMDVTKDLEAARIVRDLGIVKVPTLVTAEKTEQGIKLCALENKRVKCVQKKAT